MAAVHHVSEHWAQSGAPYSSDTIKQLLYAISQEEEEEEENVKEEEEEEEERKEPVYVLCHQ